MTDASIRVDTASTVQEMREMRRLVSRATMWGLREVGRSVTREMRRRAPVYRGDGRSVHVREVKRERKAARTGGRLAADFGGRPVVGLLRDSIKPTRSVRRLGDSVYSLKIGPRGQRVHLYAGRVNARSRYAEEGLAAALASSGEAFERGWGKAMSRYAK